MSGGKELKKPPNPEIYTVTAYCSCQKCCGKKPGDKAYGITASGKRVRTGMIACNHLDFGTVVEIEGLGSYTVEDRGSTRYFGTRKKIVKHIDVYMDNHKKALVFGKREIRVWVKK